MPTTQPENLVFANGNFLSDYVPTSKGKLPLKEPCFCVVRSHVRRKMQKEVQLMIKSSLANSFPTDGLPEIVEVQLAVDD